MYVHAYIHKDVCIHTYICMHTYKHTYIHTYVDSYIHTTAFLNKICYVEKESPTKSNTQTLSDLFTGGPTTDLTVYHLCLESMREPYGTSPSRVRKRLRCMLHWPAGSHTMLRAFAVILAMSMFKSKCRQSETAPAWEPVLEPRFHRIKRGLTGRWACAQHVMRSRETRASSLRHTTGQPGPPLLPLESPAPYTHPLACGSSVVWVRPARGGKFDPHGGAIKLMGDWQSSLKPGQGSITAVTLQLLTSPASLLSPQQHQRNPRPSLQEGQLTFKIINYLFL